MNCQNPVHNVIAAPTEKVKPNTYSPNKAALPGRCFLYESIEGDGYTMPVVCYYTKAQDLYLIADGLHRYQVMLGHPDIYEREQGFLPVSVIDKPIDKRMTNMIRHNRVRGTHNVDLMSDIVKKLYELGRLDAWISKHLGMDRDEILHLKQIAGLATLSRDVKFGQAWRPAKDDQDRDDGRQVPWFVYTAQFVTGKQ